MPTLVSPSSPTNTSSLACIGVGKQLDRGGQCVRPGDILPRRAPDGHAAHGGVVPYSARFPLWGPCGCQLVRPDIQDAQLPASAPCQRPPRRPAVQLVVEVHALGPFAWAISLKKNILFYIGKKLRLNSLNLRPCESRFPIHLVCQRFGRNPYDACYNCFSYSALCNHAL